MLGIHDDFWIADHPDLGSVIWIFPEYQPPEVNAKFRVETLVLFDGFRVDHRVLLYV